MSKLDQKKKAETFLAMHSGSNALVLPNVWDVASARIIEDAGFPAVATTSAGVAFSLGYPDGERIPREEMLAPVARIARAVRVPVTADVEAGYGPTPEDAARTARPFCPGAQGKRHVPVNGRRANSRRDEPTDEPHLKLRSLNH
ncbi:MAG: isocitrate lyase/phosphoenolpyruvate mutase family protein [Acidobacteriia bacterium]|nr:isocitrate lyase/phosphoenolpyruvate mutase family protein [Terriglobia bacterium]